MEPDDTHDDDSVMGRMASFTWIDQESTGFEAAIEAINDVVGCYSALIAAERAKPAPDQQAIDEARAGRAKCHEVRRTLDPVDHDRVAQVRRDFAALARDLAARRHASG